MITQSQEIDKLRLCIRRLRSAVADLLVELNKREDADKGARSRAEDALDFEADTREELYES